MARPSPAGACALLLLLVIGLAACGPEAKRVTSAAPPLVVCGTTLSASPAGPVMYDIGSRRPLPTVTLPTVGHLVYVKVSDDCRRGVTVTLVPADTFAIATSAVASDGEYAAVVLRPLRLTPTRLTALRVGQVVGSLEIELRNA